MSQTTRVEKIEIPMTYRTSKDVREGLIIFEEKERGSITVSVLTGGIREIGRIEKKAVVRVGRFYDD